MKALRIMALILAVMMLTGCCAGGGVDKNISSSDGKETTTMGETTSAAGIVSVGGNTEKREKGDSLNAEGQRITSEESAEETKEDERETEHTEKATVPVGDNSGKGEQSHVHSWEEITEIIHHDAVTENVWIVDKAAWDETITEEVPVYGQRLVIVATCRGCGGQFSGYDQDEVVEVVCEHIHNTHGNTCGYGFEASYWEEYQTGTELVTKTVHHDEEGHYETRVKEKAWDEKIIKGYRCTECGEVK